MAEGAATVTPKAAAIAPKRRLQVLYLFAGPTRKSGYGQCLKMAARRRGMKVEVQEIDLLRGGTRHNLLLGAKRKHWLQIVRDGRYDIVGGFAAVQYVLPSAVGE